MDVERIGQLIASQILRQDSAELLHSRTVQCPASLVHRLEFSIGGASKAVFVKLPHDKGPNYEFFVKRLRNEFEVTKKVHSAFPKNTELTTVMPAGFIDDISGLVTWEIRGKTLQHIINSELRFRVGGPAPRLLHLCHLAGQWLREFHSLHFVEADSDLRPSLSEYYRERLRDLECAAGSKVTQALSASLSRRLADWLDQSLEGPNAKPVLCHNDFSPHNMIVSGKQLCVLDFSFAGPGLPAFDAACFWHKLEDLKTSPLHSAKALGVLQMVFLSGYGEAFDLTRPEAKLGLARLVLSKMITLLRERSLRPDNWIDSRRRYARYLALLESGFAVRG